MYLVYILEYDDDYGPHIAFSREDHPVIPFQAHEIKMRVPVDRHDVNVTLFVEESFFFQPDKLHPVLVEIGVDVAKRAREFYTV